jgi:hypothetical protein
MIQVVEDFDYTHYIKLRGKIVILCGIPIFRCAACGPSADVFEIARMGPLHRELDAAQALHVKKLWCRLVDNEWVVAVSMAPRKKGSRK